MLCRKQEPALRGAFASGFGASKDGVRNDIPSHHTFPRFDTRPGRLLIRQDIGNFPGVPILAGENHENR